MVFDDIFKVGSLFQLKIAGTDFYSTLVYKIVEPTREKDSKGRLKALDKRFFQVDKYTKLGELFNKSEYPQYIKKSWIRFYSEGRIMFIENFNEAI